MSVVFVCLHIEDKPVPVPVPVFRIPHHQTQVRLVLIIVSEDLGKIDIFAVIYISDHH